MKRIVSFFFIPLISVALIGCASQGGESQINNASQQVEDSRPLEDSQQVQDQEQTELEEAIVVSLVERFGLKLKEVSLLAPSDLLKESMQESYGELVSQSLIDQWISDPLNAPGRLTSSPWPDSIEINDIEKISEDVYEIKGTILEITSVEVEKGGIAASRPIAIEVIKTGDRWWINTVDLGAYEDVAGLEYRNTQYGFDFPLPGTWEGYEVITSNWEGQYQNSDTLETGPLIAIRHPEWTQQVPRQDIPIMVFTIEQWDAMQQEAFHIGAAPFGPSELGRNAKYVFALPARYNFAFPVGFEEVEDILERKPLIPIAI